MTWGSKVPGHRGGSLSEWVTTSRDGKEGLVSCKGLSRDPEGRRRQPEWLRDHILKCLWCQGHAGLERHKVGEEQNQVCISERSLRLLGREGGEKG